MTNEPKEKTDLFGLAAYGEAINTLSKGAVDGAGAFLSRICLPAAEEFGFLLRDKVSAWRASNAIEIAQKAEHILGQQKAPDTVHAHPRMVMKILSEGSWSDNEKVKTLWAGLLASSCTCKGDDESNVIFINILSQLTALQVRILDHYCSKAKVNVSEHGFIFADRIEIDLDELKAVADTDELHRVDRELDHLSSLNLVGGTAGFGGIDLQSARVLITPTPLALQMYARCKGHTDSPETYFDTEQDET